MTFDRHGSDRSPSVAMVSASVSRNGGGIFEAMLGLSRALQSFGVDVSVHGVRDAFTAQDSTQWDPCRVHASVSVGPASFAYSPQMVRALLIEKPDVAHLHGLWMYPSYLVKRWVGKGNGPSIISPHGMLDSWALCNSYWKKRIALRLFEEANLSRAACIHALNDAELASIRRLGLDRPVAVIPNGVAVPSLATRVQSSGRKQLLFLGRIHPKKGLVSLLRAWAQLQVRNSAIRRDWELVIAGWDDGGHEVALRELATNLSVSKSVTFTGPLFGLAKDAMLRNSSAFILPSLSEGMPMAVLEAWAWELPVLMTPACNLEIGFTRKAAFDLGNDAALLAERIEEALISPDLELMGQLGRELVIDRYSWTSVASKFQELYDWVVNGGSPPLFVESKKPRWRTQ